MSVRYLVRISERRSFETFVSDYGALLQKAIDRDDELSKHYVDYFDSLGAGEVIMLEIIDTVKNEIAGISLIEFMRVGGVYCLDVILLSGHGYDDWNNELQVEYEAIAKKIDVKRIRMRGRLGWLKKLEAHGYQFEKCTMFKELI
jgi:hypothetical protein